MNNINFTNYLTSNLGISEEQISIMLGHCKIRQVAKDEFLLRPGEFCNHTFFVEKGLLRQYIIDDRGKEHILYFAPEGWFVTDRASVFFQEESQYFIQAIEETRVALIDDSFLKQLETKVPGFRDFNHRLLHNHIRSLQNRTVSLLSNSAEERYLAFVDNYPDIPLRVPQTMIASYLGIAPESLSRVRKELAQKNFKQ